MRVLIYFDSASSLMFVGGSYAVRVLRLIRTNMLDLHSKRQSPILLERWLDPTVFPILSSRPLREVPHCCRFVSCSVVCLYVRLTCVSDASLYWNVEVKTGPPSL